MQYEPFKPTTTHKKEKKTISSLNLLNGVPGAIRTPDRSLRRGLLYPAELRGQLEITNKVYNII